MKQSALSALSKQEQFHSQCDSTDADRTPYVLRIAAHCKKFGGTIPGHRFTSFSCPTHSACPSRSKMMHRTRIRATATVYIHAAKAMSSIPTSMIVAMEGARVRSEEHTSELQSLMRISYAVFCLKKKKQPHVK